MSITNNPVFTGSLALVAGNLLGSSIDKLMGILKERANLTSDLPLNQSSKRILDDSISILLHVGALSLGTSFVFNGPPKE